jgi:hypothetical protein
MLSRSSSTLATPFPSPNGPELFQRRSLFWSFSATVIPLFSASPREEAAQAAVPFLKFSRAIGCGHAIEVRSTRSWSEHDAFAIGTQGSNPLFGQ